MVKAAYDELAAQTPFLPFPESVLPALIALRKTHQTVEDTKAYLASHGEGVEKAKKRLQAEQSALRDQQVLSQSLHNRIRALRDGADSRMEMGPDDIAQERIGELKQKKVYQAQNILQNQREAEPVDVQADEPAFEPNQESPYNDDDV